MILTDKLSKQKKIGYVSFLGMFLIFVSNLFLFLFYDLKTCYNSTSFNIVFTFFASLLFLFTAIKESNNLKLLQIFDFIFVSIIIAIANKDPANVTSIVFLIFSFVLIWVYFKNKIRILYYLVFIGIILIFIILLQTFLIDFFNQYIDFSSCLLIIKSSFAKFIYSFLSIISFFITSILFLWITLVEEIIIYLEKSNKLQIALYKSESDAWYGRNVIGIVHNIKNKLTPVYLLLEEFTNDERIDEETRKFCKTQIGSVDGLSGLLDKLMYSTKIKNKEDLETINVNKTVLSVVEFFKSNLEFKRNINMIINQHGLDIFFKCNPMNFCFVIENIIKNSYDGLKGLDKEKNINIEIVNNNGMKYISIKDNGTGISFLKENEFFGSLLDCNFFKIGNTTKKDGLGYGMEFIKSFLLENGIDADIYTKKGVGTEIKIFFSYHKKSKRSK